MTKKETVLYFDDEDNRVSPEQATKVVVEIIDEEGTLIERVWYYRKQP